MDWEDHIDKIEDLVERNINREFTLNELKPLIDELNENSKDLPENLHDRVSSLFKKISSMRKSTYFGANFYMDLKNTDFPFILDVLGHAVLNEPYYNCKAEAVESFAMSTLKEMGLPFNRKHEQELYTIGSSESVKYSGGEIDRSSPKYKKMKEMIEYSLKDSSHHMFHGGIGLVLYLEIDGFSDDIKKILAREIEALEFFTEPNNIINLRAAYDHTLSIAKSLFRITQDPVYKEIVNLVKGELDFIGDSFTDYSYHERFLDVYEKLKEMKP